ncbi:MAG: hypothetical protein IT270_12615 [Saprospiraceae bacterium]|nr:hypothetical protein [Saprospiraceae bacterium]
MNKQWIKTGEGRYNFLVNGQVVGNISIATNTTDRRAVATLGDNTYTIRHNGFWKNGLEIIDQHGKQLATAQPANWFSSTMALEFRGKKYNLKVRNNPLAEWVVTHNSLDVLAYGLDAGHGKPAVRITSAAEQADYLLDFLLWYCFVPIAMENTTDELFLLLVA